MKLNKIHLAIISVLICAVAVLVWQMSISQDKCVAQIVSDGEIIDTIDLSKVTELYEFEIRNERGYNKVRAEQGKIAVIEADCPDKVCVNQGYIEGGGLPIVCLPHRLTITMQSSDIDAVSGR